MPTYHINMPTYRGLSAVRGHCSHKLPTNPKNTIFQDNYFILRLLYTRNMKSTFKTLHPDDCVLQRDRIDIWQFSLEKEFIGANALLNEEETLRAKRYHFDRHRRRFTVARATMRLILACYLRTSPTALSFNYQAHGKPELITEVSLQFNLSHSGNLALLAVGQDHSLGVDLEFFSNRPYEGIGQHLFSINENNALAKVNTPLKPLVFFRLWSQKEAFIKASGLGLSYPTTLFDVDAFPEEEQSCIDHIHNHTWRLRSFMPCVACHAALCYDPSVKTLRYFTLTGIETHAKTILT